MDDTNEPVEEGTLEDLRRLKHVVEALTEDNQHLIAAVEHQQRQILGLQRWLATAFFFLTVSISATIWLLLH